MDKREFNAFVAGVCGCAVTCIAIFAAVYRLFGARGAGLLLLVAAFFLLRISAKVALASRQNEKRPPIGPTAEEVARVEMTKRLAGWPNCK